MLLLDEKTRTALWDRLARVMETYTRKIAGHRVTAELDPGRIRALLAPFDFTKPMAPLEAVDFAATNLTRYQTHTPHPRYYGLFNPAPTTMGIAADALAAAFNPQLAAWSHSPFAVEVEQHLVRAFAGRFGYEPASSDGTFASGGAEANHTAVAAALTHAHPDFGSRGLRSLPAQPVLYTSAESHHSFLKAARLCGLGADAVRLVPVDASLRMDVAALSTAVSQDCAAGLSPFLVAATAGTTNAGVIDPLPECAEVAARHGLWYHVDAAWGGGAALVPEFQPLLEGIARADSITFDAHKWLSVPMGAGMFLTRHATILERTFRTTTAYMPRDAAGMDVVDPHLHSMQWSRRFIGLKVFLSLLVAGWDGYAEAIRHQAAMGQHLRGLLQSNGWKVVNPTPLPVVCFVDAAKDDAAWLQKIAMKIVRSGEAWISTTRIGQGRTVLRACITNYRTAKSDLEALIQSLEAARRP